MRVLGVIPARWASSRFPGKPLAMIRGRSMVMRVYDRAVQSGIFDKVVVATEDVRILQHVHDMGGNALMTSSSHRSGTERCAETHELMMRKTGRGFDAVINIQGDEPLVEPELLRTLAREFKPGGQGIFTLASVMKPGDERDNPDVVKVVCDLNGNALYFSRFPLPFLRDAKPDQRPVFFPFMRHLGLYAYYTTTLMAITRLKPSPLEKAESLEQLRWLENAYPIKVLVVNATAIGVDRPEDIQKVEALLEE